MLGQPDPGSPQTIAFEELGDSSVPLSPNCVQAGHSQEMPADGVSPDTPGFVMRPAGVTQRLPGAALPLPLTMLVTRFSENRLLLLSVLRFRHRAIRGRMAL